MNKAELDALYEKLGGRQTVQNFINGRRTGKIFWQSSVPSDRMVDKLINDMKNEDEREVRGLTKTWVDLPLLQKAHLFTAHDFRWLLPTRKITMAKDLMKLNEHYEMIQKHSKYCSIDEFNELPSPETTISINDVIHNNFIPKINYDELTANNGSKLFEGYRKCYIDSIPGLDMDMIIQDNKKTIESNSRNSNQTKWLKNRTKRGK